MIYRSKVTFLCIIVAFVITLIPIFGVEGGIGGVTGLPLSPPAWASLIRWPIFIAITVFAFYQLPDSK